MLTSTHLLYIFSFLFGPRSNIYSTKDKTHRMPCKMSSSKKSTCKGTLRQVFICLWAHNPIPPTGTHCMHVHKILVHTGREGGVEPWEKEKGQFTKLGRKYQHDWLYLQSINSDNHLPQSSCTGQSPWYIRISNWLIHNPYLISNQKIFFLF